MGLFEQNPLAFFATVTVIGFLAGWLGSEARGVVHRWLDQ